MKLIRFGPAGDEKPGLYINEETILDLSGFGNDFDERFFEDDGLNRLQNWIDENRKNLVKIDTNYSMSSIL